MKTLSPQKQSELLSQYLDGALSADERHDVDYLLATSPSAREELNELTKLKGMMAATGRLDPDIGFWTRLSIKLEDMRAEEENLLPFPRKHLPIVAMALTVVLAIVGTTTIMNRMSIVSFFGKQSQAVKEVYEKGILTGSVLPLFTNVDKDRALQFSLFGELPLDEESKTSLRVDESAEQGYRIEVGKRSMKRTTPVTFDRFVQEVKPTPVQRRVIDSLLNLAQDRLASAVFVDEGNAFAVDPDLPKLNRIMVTGIASCLEPNQRKDFERLLAVNESPYAVSAEHASPAIAPTEVFSRLRGPHAGRFLVITPDTAIVEDFHINLDSLRAMMGMNLQRMEEARRGLVERMEAGQFARTGRGHPDVERDPRSTETEVFRVDVGPAAVDLPAEFRVMVSPRFKNRSDHVRGEVRIRIYGNVPPQVPGVTPPPVVVEVDSGR
jgi:hypothetical protein